MKSQCEIKLDFRCLKFSSGLLFSYKIIFNISLFAGFQNSYLKLYWNMKLASWRILYTIYCIRYTVYGPFTYVHLSGRLLMRIYKSPPYRRMLQSWTDDSKSRLHWKCWLNDLLEVIELTFWFEKAFKMIKIVSKGERSSSLLTSLINFWEFN